MKFVSLFPPYLEKGSKGPAVKALQQHLASHGFAAEGLMTDGVYGDVTVASVQNLQRGLSMTGDDIDGKFGPATRREWKLQMRVDIEAIPDFSGDEQTTWFGQGANEDGSLWPEDDDADPEDDTLDVDTPGDPDGD